jgi:hypothetical protein
MKTNRQQLQLNKQPSAFWCRPPRQSLKIRVVIVEPRFHLRD